MSPVSSRTRRVSIGCALALLTTLPFAYDAGAGTSKPAGADKPAARDVVARVGATDLTTEDLRAYLNKLDPREREGLAKNPALLSQTVRALLANRIVLQQALAKKFDQQPAIVAQLERVRETALVELYLQSVSTPPASYPSDDELQKVYDANRSKLLVPRQYQLAQIFVPLDAGADGGEDKARRILADIATRLKSTGEDFTHLAHELGVPNDGNLGWLPEAQMRPEIRTKVVGMAQGEVSEPIKLEDGWHVIKLLDTHAAYTATLPEVRDQLIERMRSERASALRRAFLGELLREHPPILNELALSNLVGASAPAGH